MVHWKVPKCNFGKKLQNCEAVLTSQFGSHWCLLCCCLCLHCRCLKQKLALQTWRSRVNYHCLRDCPLCRNPSTNLGTCQTALPPPFEQCRDFERACTPNKKKISKANRQTHRKDLLKNHVDFGVRFFFFFSFRRLNHLCGLVPRAPEKFSAL